MASRQEDIKPAAKALLGTVSRHWKYQCSSHPLQGDNLSIGVTTKWKAVPGIVPDYILVLDFQLLHELDSLQ